MSFENQEGHLDKVSVIQEKVALLFPSHPVFGKCFIWCDTSSLNSLLSKEGGR